MEIFCNIKSIASSAASSDPRRLQTRALSRRQVGCCQDHSPVDDLRVNFLGGSGSSFGSEGMSVENRPDLRWGVERKLKYIESRLFWDFFVSCGDVADILNVSLNQASTNISRNIMLALGNLSYNKSATTYVRNTSFNQLSMKPESGLYLVQVCPPSDGGLLSKYEVSSGNTPNYQSILLPKRVLLPNELRGMVFANRRNAAVEVPYQPISTPVPQWCWIFPDALGLEALSWHGRVYCEKSQQFNDFVLSCIEATRQSRSTELQASKVNAWHETLNLEIRAHRASSEGQRLAIELYYGATEEQIKTTVLGATLHYALRRMGLDMDPNARRSKTQQAILLKADQVLPFNGYWANS
jgi:hypothetical protein